MLWPVFCVVIECSAVKCLPAMCRLTLSQKALKMFPRIKTASVTCVHQRIGVAADPQLRLSVLSYLHTACFSWEKLLSVPVILTSSFTDARSLPCFDSFLSVLQVYYSSLICISPFCDPFQLLSNTILKCAPVSMFFLKGFSF